MAENLEDFVAAILQHEGLKPGQTPFRVTNPKMRQWNTIHGYAIDKTASVPGRENFLFLKNPADVQPAVTAQLRRYATQPSRYGLQANPTVRQALGVFDQSGLKGKLNYLTQRGYNVDAPLLNLFPEDSQ